MRITRATKKTHELFARVGVSAGLLLGASYFALQVVSNAEKLAGALQTIGALALLGALWWWNPLAKSRKSQNDS